MMECLRTLVPLEAAELLRGHAVGGEWSKHDLDIKQDVLHYSQCDKSCLDYRLHDFVQTSDKYAPSTALM